METRVTPVPLTTPPADASRAGVRIPPEAERLVFERLALFDLPGAERPLGELTRAIGRAARTEWRAASLAGFEFLSALNRLLYRTHRDEPRRLANRDALVAAFAGVSRSSDVLRTFRDALETLLLPFRGARPGQHPAIPRAKSFIQETYHRKISLREVAAHLGLSRTYLSTLFHRECGCTLTEYLHRIRLRRAEELIRSGAPALSVVASEVGYQNYRDFHRNFVRYQDVSPLQFKKRLAHTGALPPPPAAEQV